MRFASSDIKHLFTSKNFTPVFKTVLLKQSLLFLWNLPILRESSVRLHVYKILLEKLPAHTVLTAQWGRTADSSIHPLVCYWEAFDIGWSRHHRSSVLRYSQAELILYDQLETDTHFRAFFCYPSKSEAREGLQGKLFMLDLSFIGWNLSEWLTVYWILWFSLIQRLLTFFLRRVERNETTRKQGTLS